MEVIEKQCQWDTDDSRKAYLWALMRKECELTSAVLGLKDFMENERHEYRGRIIALQKARTIILTKVSLRRAISSIKREMGVQDRRLAEASEIKSSPLLLVLGFSVRNELHHILNELETMHTKV